MVNNFSHNVPTWTPPPQTPSNWSVDRLSIRGGSGSGGVAYDGAMKYTHPINDSTSIYGSGGCNNRGPTFGFGIHHKF